MGFHEITAGLAVICSVTASSVYIRDIVYEKTRPHLFTWLVWAIVMGVATAIALLNDAYASAVVIGFGSFMCSIISLLSLRYGEKSITRSDWVMFIAALSIIPIWALTKEPLVAALLATSIDTLGYGPTFRKAWMKPWEENLKSFSIMILQSALSVLSVTPFLVVTGLYPSAILTMNVALVSMLLFRRQTLSRTQIS